MHNHRPSVLKSLLLLFGVASLAPHMVYGQFNPPRVIMVLPQRDAGNGADDLVEERSCYIDKGREVNINRGDILNVYRELFPFGDAAPSMRVLIGTLRIKFSQTGSASGTFIPSRSAMEEPLIKYGTLLKGDLVVPRLIIDSSVLFDPGKSGMKQGAAQELQKVANFVKMFSPGKLVIEGHTDADGPDDYNKKLSENRANLVRDYLIQRHDFITEKTIDAIGYGEEQPIADNDTAENKALNRRIEIVVWD